MTRPPSARPRPPLRSIRSLLSIASLASLAAFAGYCALDTTAAGVAAIAVPACSIDDAGGITPITGIVVRSGTLVAGHGCGTGPDQIFKYSVVVSAFDEAGATQVFVAGGTYDCFADATFVNLCSSSSGSYVFNVNVYAFTQAQWLATNGASPASVQSTLVEHASYCTNDAGKLPPQVADKAVSLDAPDGGVDGELLAKASFVTTCTATQESSAEVVAVCGPVTAAH